MAMCSDRIPKRPGPSAASGPTSAPCAWGRAPRCRPLACAHWSRARSQASPPRTRPPWSRRAAGTARRLSRRSGSSSLASLGAVEVAGHYARWLCWMIVDHAQYPAIAFRDAPHCMAHCRIRPVCRRALRVQQHTLNPGFVDFALGDDAGSVRGQFVSCDDHYQGQRLAAVRRWPFLSDTSARLAFEEASCVDTY